VEVLTTLPTYSIALNGMTTITEGSTFQLVRIQSRSGGGGAMRNLGAYSFPTGLH